MAEIEIGVLARQCLDRRIANQVELSEEEACPLLESGEITGGYRMPWGSNYTFIACLLEGGNRNEPPMTPTAHPSSCPRKKRVLC